MTWPVACTRPSWSRPGFGGALHVLAQRSALPVRLHLHADDRMPAESEATAYYVVSEAFANAVKHALRIGGRHPGRHA